jgi:hypothetical protein
VECRYHSLEVSFVARELGYGEGEEEVGKCLELLEKVGVKLAQPPPPQPQIKVEGEGEGQAVPTPAPPLRIDCKASKIDAKALPKPSLM